MVIRRRWRAIVFPLVLYAVSGSVTSYFVWHAFNGERGLRTKDINDARMAALSEELDGLRKERMGWERRVEMMRAESVDRDLLDEEARVQIGRVHKNELVIHVPVAVRRD